MTRLRGDRVILRPLRPEDVPPLAALAAHPSVARWWPGLSEEKLRGWLVGEDETHSLAIELDGTPIGVAQFWEETDPEYRHAGMDLFLGEPYQGQGLGADVLRTLARHLFDDRGHHRLVIDPSADNTPATRCYEKVGFKRVGVLRRYERSSDGLWRDGVLFDLLAEELQAPDRAGSSRTDS
jgi:aminoglycoside 6'-N-acetyltransferase